MPKSRRFTLDEVKKIVNALNNGVKIADIRRLTRRSQTSIEVIARICRYAREDNAEMIHKYLNTTNTKFLTELTLQGMGYSREQISYFGDYSEEDDADNVEYSKLEIVGYKEYLAEFTERRERVITALCGVSNSLNILNQYVDDWITFMKGE